MTREPIPSCPQPETPIRDRAWTEGQKLNAAVIALKVFRTWAACGALYPEHVIKVCDETLADIGAKS